MALTKKEKKKILNYFLVTQGLEIKEITEFYGYLLLPPYGVIPFKDKIYQDKFIQQDLNLWNNKIENIKPLSSLINLKELYLHTNKIENIEALSSLTNLKMLNLFNNKIE